MRVMGSDGTCARHAPERNRTMSKQTFLCPVMSLSMTTWRCAGCGEEWHAEIDYVEHVIARHNCGEEQNHE